jgi:S-adenosylmethionine-dependent carboxyl methyltransferase
MIEVSKVITPAPMEGHGGYNRSSRVQAAGSSPALPLLEHAARIVPLPSAPAPIVIADYGASEGRNSLAPMGVAIGALRDRVGRERAISVIHTDLPDSDFTALFQLLASDPVSYTHLDSAAFASAVGRSFYQQILPSDSVTLGWSSWAVQWLSCVPTTIPDQLQVACSSDSAARAAFARQADEDWRSFLAHRGCEMRAGARLVVLTMARDDAGDFGYRPLLQAMYATLLELVDHRLVRADEAHRMVIPTVGRTREEFAAPFGHDGHFAGLGIEHLDVFNGEDRIWLEFERNRDAQTFGAQWAAFSRASVFPTLAAELEGGRTDPRASAFVERMEAGVAQRMAVAPERMQIPLGKMVFAKGPG